MKWRKLSDKFYKYQCVLEPLIVDLKDKFVNGPRNALSVNATFNNLTKAIHKVAKNLPHSKF